MENVLVIEDIYESNEKYFLIKVIFIDHLLGAEVKLGIFLYNYKRLYYKTRLILI